MSDVEMDAGQDAGLQSKSGKSAIGLTSVKSTNSKSGRFELPPLGSMKSGTSSKKGKASMAVVGDEVADVSFEALLHTAAARGMMLHEEQEDEPGCSVMVSHARNDAQFVKTLRKALEGDNNRHVWVDDDESNIDDDNDDWMDRIYRAIETADVFICVLSPAALDSEVCSLEIERAIKHGKRIVPVVCVNVNFKQVRKEIAQLNWIFFRDDGDDFNKSLKLLVKTLDENKMHCKYHTRILTRAIYWENIDYEKSALLKTSFGGMWQLCGDQKKDLLKAQEWLNNAALGNEPRPTKLQMSFISSSRQLHEVMKKRFMVAAFFFFIVTIAASLPDWGVFFFSLIFSHLFIWYASGY